MNPETVPMADPAGAPQHWEPAAEAPPAAPDLLRLLGVPGIEALHPQPAWPPRPYDRRLRAPIGLDPAGAPVVLDLKQVEAGGFGPHGLIVGADGSGRDELLRDVLLGLALTHPPEAVNFVLLGHRDAPELEEVAGLPHVLGTALDLAHCPRQRRRMTEQLQGEVDRRHQLQLDGGHPRFLEYQEAIQSGDNLPQLPAIVCAVAGYDVLAADPALRETLLWAAKAGPRGGLHLLLTTNEIDTEQFRGLYSHLAWRIALRTNDEETSRIALGTPDAARLPVQNPGTGFLRTGMTGMTEFQAVTSGSSASRLVRTLAGWSPPPPTAWLPAPAPHDLDTVLYPLVITDDGRLLAKHTHFSPQERLSTPIGVLDDPGALAHYSLLFDFAGPHGHLAAYGQPGSGTSTALCTLLASLALRHPADQVGCLLVDLDPGGRPLSALRELGNVLGSAGADEPEQITELVYRAGQVVRSREALFSSLGIESIEVLRQRRLHGEPLDEWPSDVFLLIDGWPRLRERFPDLVPLVEHLVDSGPLYGVHLALATDSWQAIDRQMRSKLGTTLELHEAGRGVEAGGHDIQVARPRIQGCPDLPTLAATLARFSAVSPQPAPVLEEPVAEVLPEPEPEPETRGPEIVAPQAPPPPPQSTVTWDPVANPHFAVFGEAGPERTGLLRALMREVTQRHPATQSKVLLFDYRSELRDAAEELGDHLVGYADDPETGAEMLRDLHALLRNRLPPVEVPAEAVRDRNWWNGPDLYLVVDDYDGVSAGPIGLSWLSPLLPIADDLGFHLLLSCAPRVPEDLADDPLLDRLCALYTPREG
ncbi:FtsK/SpoIIIE domain-containing protein [Allokutzneria sp. A3M-2-11 16]|uniref:FtsK/SpoIIIE domain-containing protein n=1 Tax=Allokutzneria sp. A3M-2-11 16 TaxID=2962043 RepID=UPI0020B8D946|nr:FtsK/SpoIIIE domain-containing protein [Allokutzneria sp. A3M-2-11 16]MCP3801616.1 FtsK/SpoIIIE domain-containing protein [Allokutzneria sp. A3M-2-11 16]